MSYYSEARKYQEVQKFAEAYKLYEQGAREGDPKCCYGIAYLAYMGLYLERNCAGAQKIFKECYKDILLLAKKGDSDAMLIMAYYYSKGFYVDIDKEKAVKWASMSAEKGNASACAVLGMLYDYDGLLETNLKKAVEWYIKAAEKGNTVAQVRLGSIYFEGQGGVGKSEEDAFKWTLLAAKAGVDDAQTFVATCLFSGTGVKRDVDEAMKWCKLAADQGNENAIDFLEKFKAVIVYEKIDGGIVCEPEEISMLERLRAKGESGVDGVLVMARLARARALAKKKDLDSMLESLGNYEALIQDNKLHEAVVNQEVAPICYAIAKELESDADNKSRVFEYYTKADKYGYNEAKFDIAIAYYNGEIVVRNYPEAIYNFKKCTKIGIEEGKSHYYLGNCFYWGLGVPVDMDAAKKHYMEAYEYGFNCNYSIDILRTEEFEKVAANSMREYAESFKKMNLPEDKRSIQIVKDLTFDFEGTWEMLKKESRKALSTAMDIYVYIYLKGPNIYGNYDFSSSISEMCKAFEIELVYYLYSKYIEYLENKKISPNSFVGKRTFLKKISATEYAYVNPNKTENITLGTIDLTIGAGKKGAIRIDESMLEYLDSIFKDDAFSCENRREEISKYILSLSDSVSNIVDDYRNHAVHCRAMKCDKAELCGDYIIKGRKLLHEFLFKLK